MNAHTQLIQVFNGRIGEDAQPLVNARDLHKFLESKQDFSTWIKNRIEQYGFIENQDYLLHKIMEQLPSGAKHVIEYHITLDMAKELSMVERNAKGKQARRYFIACEKQLLEALTAPKKPAVQDMDFYVDVAPNKLALLKEIRAVSREFSHAKKSSLHRQQLGQTLCQLNLLAGFDTLIPLVQQEMQTPCTAYSDEDDYVVQFWDNYRVLSQTEKLNHAFRAEYIAIHLPYFIQACQRHNLPLAEKSQLTAALTKSEHLITANLTAHSNLLKKTVKVWLFKAEVLA